MKEVNRNSWLGGLVLIILGFVFLLQNMTHLSFGNWWALFILVPALYAFWQAWRFYQEDSKLTRRVANTIYGGLFPFLIALIFLFNLNLGRLWPIFLMVIGIGALFGLRVEDEDKQAAKQT